MIICYTYPGNPSSEDFSHGKGKDMKISDLRELLKDKRVMEEINKHLWIESQKAGYSIGLERATDEWIRLYAAEWMKYHNPEKYNMLKDKKKR